MDCNFEMNGVALNDNEVRELQSQALSELDMERRAMITQKYLDSNTLVKRLQEAGAINLKKWNGKLRVPRGRFASDLVEKQALHKLNRANKRIKNEYGINTDVFNLVPTQNGYNIEISDGAIAQANENLRKAMEDPFSEDLIEAKMNQLLFLRNDLNGYDSYDMREKKRNEAKVDSLAEKTNNLIEHRKSMASLARNQLTIINSKIKNAKSTDPNYEQLLRIRADLDERLNGTEPTPGQEGKKGLMDEIAELEKTRNRTTALTFLGRDIDRIGKLLADNTPASLTEARLILSVYDAYRNSLNTKSSTNPIFTIAEMDVIKEGTAEQKKGIQGIYSYVEQLANTVEKLNYRTNLKKQEERMIEKVVMRDKKLQQLYKDKDSLNFEKLFKQTMKDATWWDTTMMDGVVGTFADLGPVPQLQKNMLNNLMNHYVSMHTKWTEKLNDLQPAVEEELKQLGYGLGVFKMGGVSYRLFRQQDGNGRFTTKLVNRAAHKFQTIQTRQNDSYYRTLRNPNNTFKQKKAALNTRNEWRKKNTFLVDPRKMQVIKDKFPEFAEYFVEDSNFEDEMKLHLDSTKGYDETIAEVVSQVEEFVAERDRIIKDLLADTGKNSIDELDVDDKHAYEQFEARNNPFLAAQSYMLAQEHKFNNTKAMASMDKYNTFIPRRYKTANNLSKNSLNEYVYLNTGEETGYYDEFYKTIEENDALYKFYNHVTEILDTCSKMLPPDKQNELMNRSFLGIRQTLLEIALDPDTSMMTTLSKGANHLMDKWKGLWKTNVEPQEQGGVFNPFTGELHSEVKTRFITTNKKTINDRFKLNGNLFITHLSPSAKNMLRDKEGNLRVQRTSVIPLNMISAEGLKMLSTWLGVDNNIDDIMGKLELKERDGYVPIGRIIDSAVTSQVAADETFNLPKMLKLYSLGATTYAAMNEAKPTLEIIKNYYKEIPKAQTTNTGLQKIFTRRTSTGNNTTSDLKEGSREKANAMAEKWHEKNVLGKVHPSVYGVLSKTKTSHLTHEEKQLYKQAQDIIETQLALPESQRDTKMIEDMMEFQQALGERYAASEAVNRLFDLTRFVGLGINVAGGVYNYLAGKIANMVNASNELYFSEKSLARAERVVLQSHLSLSRRLKTPTARKTALLMSRFRVFQDATDEVYKSSMNTAVKLPSFANVYFIQQRVEFVNQSPVLLAMLMDKEITGKNGEKSNVWDAMNNDGVLKEEFRTPENIATWEVADSQDFDDFKGRVDGAIKNIHGDYTSMGSPMKADSQLFRAAMMFKRWQIRYAHTRYATEYQDSELGIRFKGRYRSLDAGSGMAVGYAMMTAFSGGFLGVPALIGILGGGLAGEIIHNTYGDPSEKGIFDGNVLGTLRDTGTHLIQIYTKALLNPLNIATGGYLGQSRAMKYLNTVSRKNDSLDNKNLQALMTSTSLVLSNLILRMLFRYIKNLLDDDDEESRQNIALKGLINTAGNNMQEIALFMSPVDLWSSVTSVAAFRMGTNLIKLVQQMADYDEKYSTGVYAGKSKMGKLIERTLVPSLFRQDFGFNYATRKINDTYGSEKFLLPQRDKLDKEITQVRVNFKQQLEQQMYEDVTKEEKDFMINKVMEANPKISKKGAARQVEKRLKEIFHEEAANLALRTNPVPICPTLNGFEKAYTDAVHEELLELHPDIDTESKEYERLFNARMKEIIMESVEANKERIKNGTVWDDVSNLYDLNSVGVVIENW